MIPPKRNPKQPREYDKQLYEARHLIENFFAQLKQYRAISFAGAVGNRHTLRQAGGEFPGRYYI